MRDRLLHHYESELRFLRRSAAEFAEAHPDVAGGLQLDPTRCDDPHVERMIEACAMMAARIQLRLEDDFGEISRSLLSLLYPHYLAPIPSMTIVQLEADSAAGVPPDGVIVPRGTLLHAPPVEGVRARFRTAFPLRLWPLEVSSVALVPRNRVTAAGIPRGVRSAVQIELRAKPGATLSELRIDSLPFFLPGDGASVPPLYALLTRAPAGLLVETDRGTVLLGPEYIRPMGFDPNEELLEYPTASEPAYRILQEFFVFPEKFQFVELSGLARPHDTDRDAQESASPAPLGPDRLRISVLLEETAAPHDFSLGTDDLRLGCTPAVNLFVHTAEPVRLDRTRSEYEIVPNLSTAFARAGGYEIYSILRVSAIGSARTPTRELRPMYSLSHTDELGSDPGSWHSTRRTSLNPERSPSQVFLSLVDLDLDDQGPGFDTLRVETLCTNGELPGRLDFGRSARAAAGSWRRDFAIEGIQLLGDVRCLRSPTPTHPAPVSETSHWKVVSHLAVNHLSITESGDAVDSQAPGGRGIRALRELLALYDFADSALTRARIRGLVGVSSKRVTRRIGYGATAGFVQGLQVRLEFDADQYTGAGLYLFASVLERFLGLYTSVNSFTETVACVRGREGVLKRWPPRHGNACVL